MGRLIRFLIIVIAGAVAYYYFWGNEPEKEKAQTIVDNTTELVSSLTTFLKSEKDKYDEGKYDKFFDKVGNILGSIKNEINYSDKRMVDHFDDIDSEVKELEKQMEKIKDKDLTDGEKRFFEDKMNQLLLKSEELLELSKENK